MEKTTKQNFSDLVKIISRLREPDGCPWDQKQTVETFRPYLLEEMYELMEAIDLDNPQHIKEELGDLMFQIVFLNNLYEEKGLFTLDDVIDTIATKMVRRHPHVFGKTTVSSERELRRNWNKIKAGEKKKNGDEEKSLFSFPKKLPALLRSQRVSGRAVSSGFEWPDINGVFDKLDEEILELKEAVVNGDHQEIEDEIGDIFFTMVNVARKAGFDAESTLQKSTDKFIRRFTRMTELANAEGTPVEELELTEMQKFWEQAKSEE